MCLQPGVKLVDGIAHLIGQLTRGKLIELLVFFGMKISCDHFFSGCNDVSAATEFCRLLMLKFQISNNV